MGQNIVVGLGHLAGDLAVAALVLVYQGVASEPPAETDDRHQRPRNQKRRVSVADHAIRRVPFGGRARNGHRCAFTIGGVAPEIEGEQREQRFAVIGLATHVLVDEVGHPGGVEEAARLDPLGGESFSELFAETVQQPS